MFAFRRDVCLSDCLSLSILQLEDDIVARPNYFTTMKNFALQQPLEEWMILEFSQLGFIGESLALSCIMNTGPLGGRQGVKLFEASCNGQIKSSRGGEASASSDS